MRCSEVRRYLKTDAALPRLARDQINACKIQTRHLRWPSYHLVGTRCSAALGRSAGLGILCKLPCDSGMPCRNAGMIKQCRVQEKPGGQYG